MAGPATEALLAAAEELATAADAAAFGPPVACVYNPLRYAGAAYRRYITAYAKDDIRAVFLGMNPGPFGMVQTGIPFGDVRTVTGWLGIADGVSRPPRQHPARPVLGFACTRVEISGSRLWGLFAERFGTPDRFFAEHFVLNYCPLAFLDDTGRNITPDKLSGPAMRAAMRALQAACDHHLRAAVAALRPRWVVALGIYAERRARGALPAGQRVSEANLTPGVIRLLHPSPANPRAHAGWAEQATAELIRAGIWDERTVYVAPR